MSEQSLFCEIDARGVATVTLNRPDKHNAFDDAIIAALDAEFSALATRDDVRIVILAATGKSFSAGADLGWMQRMAEYDQAENLRDARALAAMLETLNTLPQPTIARVQGAAYGGAVGLVACCDMALGTPRARFCLSEVKIGLIPATISPYVINAMGQRAARRYFASAEIIEADEARRLGLLSEVCDEDGIDEQLNALVTTLLNNGPLAVRAAKRLVLDFADKAIDAELIEESCKRIADIRVSAEGQAGLQAFLNKQSAPWSNSDV